MVDLFIRKKIKIKWKYRSRMERGKFKIVVRNGL